MPAKRAASFARCSAEGSTTRTSAAAQPRASIPPMSALAMLPPPMKAIVMAPTRASLRAASPRWGRAPWGCPVALMRSARRGAFRVAEDRGADAHQRRALGDRILEIRGHPHRQRIERKARLAALVEQHAQDPILRARRVATSGVGSAMPIRPRSRIRGSAATLRASATASSGGTPLFDPSPLMLTWMQTLSGGRLAGRAAESRSAIFARSIVCTQAKRSAAASSCCSAAARSGATPRQSDQRARPSSPPLPARSSRRMRAGRTRATPGSRRAERSC